MQTSAYIFCSRCDCIKMELKWRAVNCGKSLCAWFSTIIQNFLTNYIVHFALCWNIYNALHVLLVLVWFGLILFDFVWNFIWLLLLSLQVINRRKSSNPYITRGILKFRLLQILLNALALLIIAGKCE